MRNLDDSEYYYERKSNRTTFLQLKLFNLLVINQMIVIILTTVNNFRTYFKNQQQET
jgi:hypothetical protein